MTLRKRQKVEGSPGQKVENSPEKQELEFVEPEQDWEIDLDQLDKEKEKV